VGAGRVQGGRGLGVAGPPGPFVALGPASGVGGGLASGVGGGLVRVCPRVQLAPAGRRVQDLLAQVPAFAEGPAAAVGGEGEEQAAGHRDRVAGGVHGRPPLGGDPVAVDDRVAEADPDVRLVGGDLGPVGGDAVVAGVGRAQRVGAVGGVGGEQAEDGRGVGLLPGPPVGGQPGAGPFAVHDRRL
jgi:hypothetical protein